MSARRCWLVVGLAAGVAWAGPPICVAPDGDDAAPGGRERPVQSLERARDLARAALAAGQTDVVIELAAGTYRLSRTLTLGPEDSGTPGHPTVWRAAAGARVVVSGGRPVTGWQADGDGRFKAKVELPDFRQLWVDGQRRPRARGPVPPGLVAWGEHQAVIEPAGALFGTLKVTAEAGYRVPDGALARWRHPGDLEFGYFNSWSHMVCRIERIEADGAGARIIMAQPGFFNASRKGGVQAQTPDYLENALELLDEPGEWYFDRHEQRLYYRPRPGEDLATAAVVAPALERLLEVRGTLAAPAHDIEFRGLVFAHATWLRPSQLGHPDVQANFIQPTERVYFRPEHEKGIVTVNGECDKSPANVVVHAGQRVRFERCEFTALGGAGLDLEVGAQENAVVGCVFEDISASGIQVGDVSREDHHPDDPRRTVRGNRIANCVVRRCGVEFEDSIGIFVGYTEGTEIVHNEISELPYTGVSVGWGWGIPDAGGGAYTNPVPYTTPTACRGNQILDNHIHHVMGKRNDGGGIYTLSRQPGTRIAGNHLHDNGPGVPGGIYLDEGSAEIEVTGNLVYGVATALNFNNHAQNRIATCLVHDNVATVVQRAPGIVGQALRAGRGSCVEVPYAAALDPAQLTVEAWIKIERYPAGTDPRRWAVCKAGNEWVDATYELYIDGANVGAYLNAGGGRENEFSAVSTGKPLPLNQWCQLACTYDGAVLKVFCDSREVAAKTLGKPRTVGPAPLCLGARQDRFCYLDGDLDEVRLYRRPLGPEELARNAAAVRAGRPADLVPDGLVASWGFDEPVPDEEQATTRIRAQAGLEPEFRALLPPPQTAEEKPHD
jgi:hypothetical protein